MPTKPPSLRQLLHEFTADYALLDEPLEFTYTEWSHGRAELARCVVTGLTVRQFKGRLVQTLTYEIAGAEYDVAEWEAAAFDSAVRWREEVLKPFAAWQQATGGISPLKHCHTPEDATFGALEIFAWWERRQGDGPWCWKCAKPATSRRVEGTELTAFYCGDCRGPGMHVSLDVAADGSWRSALGIPDGGYDDA
jgi:hypothetical protein